MPPRLNQGQSSFSVSHDSHQVICPLSNLDGTPCKKRCIGEKRYRSMQEHIRRAHPDHYIPKLPATEDSFQLMISSPPNPRPPQQQQQQSQGQSQSSPNIRAFTGTPDIFKDGSAPSSSKRPMSHGLSPFDRDQRHSSYSSPGPARQLEDQYPAAATAAVALAQLHSQKQDSEWGGSEVDNMSEHEPTRPNSSYDLPPIQNHLREQDAAAGATAVGASRPPRELLPSMMARSPPHGGRSTTLPPIQRSNRPRKQSLTQSARKPKHERQRSKDFKEFNRRLSIEGGPGRAKASSAEPMGSSSVMDSYKTKRWEDLIEAATSATEAADSDRDLTPIPQSPPSIKRSSLPPFPASLSHPHHNYDSVYKHSPLQRALTPPPPDDGPSSGMGSGGKEPFPSVESSHDSGVNFHMRPVGLGGGSSNSDSSPPMISGLPVPGGGGGGGSVGAGVGTGMADSSLSLAAAGRSISSGGVGGVGGGGGLRPTEVAIACANCARLSRLRDSYACNECIRGFCPDCVYILSNSSANRMSASAGGSRSCPRCGTPGVRYKPFQLDLR